MYALAPVFILIEIQRLEQEKKAFDSARASMTPEAFNAWFDAKMKVEAEQQKEAVIERRHQELCRAIKGSSFWRFGG